MMKKLFSFTLLAFFCFATVHAQVILNADFEVWIDHGNYEEPEDWNTTNPITNGAIPGVSETLVTKDTFAHTGSYSPRMESREITVPLAGAFTIPGVVTNGEITSDFGALSGLLDGSTAFSDLVNGGTPVSQRYATLTGHFAYVPAGGDEAAVIAYLSSGGEIIAEAAFYTTDLETDFVPFEAEFEYTACGTPDTLLIIMMSSSSQDGVSGSVFNVDGLDISGENTDNIIEVTAESLVTVQDSFVSVNLLDLASDCFGEALHVDDTSDPANGTVTDDGSGNYTYTPDAGFSGEDSFTFSICDGDGSCGTNTVTIDVVPTTSIFSISNENKLLNVYPNPAQNIVTFETKASEILNASIQITDITGRLVSTHELNGTYTTISVNEMANGVYFFQLIEKDGNVISNGRFAVSN